MPPFFTTRDLADGSLECKLHSNAHAVYALTVSVPEKVYNRLKTDEKLGRLQIVKKAFSADECVHLRGKIGETTRFPGRVKDYYSRSSGKGMLIKMSSVRSMNSFLFEGPLGEVLTFLKDYRDINQENQFRSWVRLWPILSGSRLCVSDTTIYQHNGSLSLLERGGNPQNGNTVLVSDRPKRQQQLRLRCAYQPSK